MIPSGEKVVETKACVVSGAQFAITDGDIAFYKKIGVPTPTLSPRERLRRRLSYRPKEYFFRPCGKCHKKTISTYSPDSDVVTYCDHCFWSDDHDAKSFATNFDFDRPFFEQFREFRHRIPRHANHAIQNENADFTIYGHKDKDCYLCDETDESRGCMFGYDFQKCTDVVDGVHVHESEACYDIVWAENCHAVFYSQNVFNSSYCAFVRNCWGCQHCLFCTNLKNQNYHIFNKPVSKEEYDEAWAYIFSGRRSDLEICRVRFENFVRTQPALESISMNTEKSSGNYLFHTKNCHQCFWSDHCKDCKYCTGIHYSQDCYDAHIYNGELLYECCNVGPEAYHNMCCQVLWYSQDVAYCQDAMYLQNCLACFGLKKQHHCILNTAYSESEYTGVFDRIRDHMRSTGEWGEFFPAIDSPLDYNHSMAQRFFPLLPHEAQSQGYGWNYDSDGSSPEERSTTPETLDNITKELTEKTFHCSVTSKPFKLTAQEIVFYKKWGIPFPSMAPLERVDTLWRRLGGTDFSSRTCDSCHQQIQTVLTIEEYPSVYCGECYRRKYFS